MKGAECPLDRKIEKKKYQEKVEKMDKNQKKKRKQISERMGKIGKVVPPCIWGCLRFCVGECGGGLEVLIHIDKTQVNMHLPAHFSFPFVFWVG